MPFSARESFFITHTRKRPPKNFPIVSHFYRSAEIFGIHLSFGRCDVSQSEIGKIAGTRTRWSPGRIFRGLSLWLEYTHSAAIYHGGRISTHLFIYSFTFCGGSDICAPSEEAKIAPRFINRPRDNDVPGRVGWRKRVVEFAEGFWIIFSLEMENMAAMRIAGKLPNKLFIDLIQYRACSGSLTIGSNRLYDFFFDIFVWLEERFVKRNFRGVDANKILIWRRDVKLERNNIGIMKV